jgi:hypothetical protein
MWLLGSASASAQETAPRRVKFVNLPAIYSKGKLITSGHYTKLVARVPHAPE